MRPVGRRAGISTCTGIVVIVVVGIRAETHAGINTTGERRTDGGHVAALEIGLGRGNGTTAIVRIGRRVAVGAAGMRSGDGRNVETRGTGLRPRGGS